MRPLLPAACALTGTLALAACGGGSGASSPPAAPVRLTVTAPGDGNTVRNGTVEVRGTVRPAGAKVLVRGEPAEVSGRSFSARVSVQPGVNVIDVLASAGTARPALTAFRVRRILQVTVPDVTGTDPDAARKQLAGDGFKVQVDEQQGGGGLLDDLFGNATPQVCSTDPDGGTKVDPGSTVTLHIAKSC